MLRAPAVSDSSRLFFALVLGASATGALLAALAPWLASPRDTAAPSRTGALLWSLLWLAWAGAAVVLVARTMAPSYGLAAGAVMFALALWGRPFAKVAGALPVGGVVGFSLLRAVGALRFAAAGEGWLPMRYAYTTAAVDVAVALAALVVAARFLPKRRVVRAWALASLVTLVATAAWQRAEVRPLPLFEALADAFLLPALAVSSALALRGARASRE